jgi:hypothetical protein
LFAGLCNRDEHPTDVLIYRRVIAAHVTGEVAYVNGEAKYGAHVFDLSDLPFDHAMVNNSVVDRVDHIEARCLPRSLASRELACKAQLLLLIIVVGVALPIDRSRGTAT